MIHTSYSVLSSKTWGDKSILEHMVLQTLSLNLGNTVLSHSLSKHGP